MRIPPDAGLSDEPNLARQSDSMNPKVSVCVPNLNTRPFLGERFDTILGQSLKDWELIVSDNFSDDGSWEFFENAARGDRRISIEQAPREGLYPNWNNCVRRARGEYVYIATSDDTMAPDCLEKLLAALERNPDCDVAHCPVITIDETGSTLSESDSPVFGEGLGELAQQYHVRRAPYDGFLHLKGEHVTISITQLLIRRSLFSRTGNFPSTWGSSGDFNWEMKAGLLANTIHVPDTWASWRRHEHQATSPAKIYGADHDRKVDDMIVDAAENCAGYLDPAVAEGLRSHWVPWARDLRWYYADLRRRASLPRRLYQFAQLWRGPKAARAEVFGRLLGKPKWPEVAATEMRHWLESLGLGPMILPANAADKSFSP